MHIICKANARIRIKERYIVMTVFLVTLFVCLVWISAYIYFGKREKQKRQKILDKNLMLRNFYQREVDNIKLNLVGLGIDENSDYEFVQAVRNIIISENLRIRVND